MTEDPGDEADKPDAVEETELPGEDETGSGPSARGSVEESGDSMNHAGESDDSFGTKMDELESMLPDEDGVQPGEIDDPFAQLEETGGTETDLDALFEEQFTESGTTDMDADSVWEAIESGSAEPAAESGEEHIVPARNFCAQCEYAADPPDPRCTYDGSEILEFVDNDHVRVRNCPIVERRNAMSELDAADGED